MGKIYKFLGLKVGAVKQLMSSEEKQDIYKCDIVYVTGQQLCFDYLEDWSASSIKRLVIKIKSI